MYICGMVCMNTSILHEVHTAYVPRSVLIFASSLLACPRFSLLPDLRECSSSLRQWLVKEVHDIVYNTVSNGRATW